MAETDIFLVVNMSLIFDYVIWPLLIILARVGDVSLATFRVILLSKGFKKLAPIVGLVEVFIWVMIARPIISDPDMNWIKIIAYSIGYALGTYVGMAIDTKLSLGNVLVRVIVPVDCQRLETLLRDANFGLTAFEASGKEGLVKVLFIVAQRAELKDLIGFIKEENPNAFYTIESVQYVNAGHFNNDPDENPLSRFNRMFLSGKKSK